MREEGTQKPWLMKPLYRKVCRCSGCPFRKTKSLWLLTGVISSLVVAAAFFERMALFPAVTADVVIVAEGILVLTVTLEIETLAGIFGRGVSRGLLKGLFVALTSFAVAAVVVGLVVGAARMVAARTSHGPEDLKVHLMPRQLGLDRLLDAELPVVFPPYKQLREVGVEFANALFIGEQTCCIFRVSLDVDGSVSSKE